MLAGFSQVLGLPHGQRPAGKGILWMVVAAWPTVSVLGALE